VRRLMVTHVSDGLGTREDPCTKFGRTVHTKFGGDVVIVRHQSGATVPTSSRRKWSHLIARWGRLCIHGARIYGLATDQTWSVVSRRSANIISNLGPPRRD
jgi:hypothetical protein